MAEANQIENDVETGQDFEQSDKFDKFDQSEKIITPGQIVMKRFMRNKLAVIGIIVLVVMAVFCFFGPIFSPYGQYELFYIDTKTGDVYSSSDNYRPPTVIVNGKAPPSSRHILGLNQDGQDVFTRLMYGGRISLVIGFACVFLELLIGIVTGGLAGYYGKWVDMLIMRIVDIFYCIPDLPVILILTSVLYQLKVPAEYQIYLLMFAIGFLGWAGVTRLIRGQILSLREQEFMLAAEASGLKVRSKIFKHLIPNVVPQIIVMATLGIGSVILLESALSFLGFGVRAPYASWGNMVGAVRNTSIMVNQPFIWLPAGLCIFFTVMAFNFIGDGLRDAFDPKMKR